MKREQSVFDPSNAVPLFLSYVKLARSQRIVHWTKGILDMSGVDVKGILGTFSYKGIDISSSE